jgi:hypothetical protein
MNVLSSAIVLIVCLGQGDPGTVVVVGGDLALVSFQLPGGSEYQIDYPTTPPAPSTVWLDSAATVPAVPFTTYIARSLGDFNGDNLVNGDDIGGLVSAVIAGPFNPEGDFNDDGMLDENDIPGFVACLLGPRGEKRGEKVSGRVA